MKMLATVILLCCFPLALLGAGLPEASLRDLIPASFPLRDPSNYTIRYLSQLQGSDSENCLVSQLHTGADSPAQVQSCRTLRYALIGQPSGYKAQYIHNIILVVSPGTVQVYNANGTVEVFHSSNLIIAKDPLQSGSATFRCNSPSSSSFNNLFFHNVSSLVLLGLTFTGCGPRPAAVGMRLVSNLRVYNCTFRDNVNTGIFVRRGSNIIFQNCIFENNAANSEYTFFSNFTHDYRKGGGLTIYQQNDTTARTALIRNCTFKNNLARINKANSEDAAQRPILYIPRGHGGGLHISFRNATGYEVVVENCSFIGNSAELTGGAISVLFYRGTADTNEVKSSSRNNTVRIDNTVFRENECSRNGGAISANTFEAANSSKIIVTNSLFQQNRANEEGGAFSFIIEDNIVINSTGQISNVPIIQGSSFVGNQSPQGGSAIRLVSNARVDQGTEKAEIYDCTFIENKANVSGHGALLSLRFPTSLMGSNVFTSNIGGAITLLQTQLYASGTVLFKNNTAKDGGAIKMEDESKLNLLENANITFHQNHASRWGGAVKEISPFLTSDADLLTQLDLCFISYEANAAVTFSSNTAQEDGAAIYMTTLLSCFRRTPHLKREEELLLLSGDWYNNSLLLEPSFQFSNNTVNNTGKPRVVEDIATEPSYFSATPSSLSGAPGQTLNLSISVKDQSGNPRDTVWSVNFRQNRYFSLSAGGMLFKPVVEYPQVQRSYEDICNQPYEEGLELEMLDTTCLEFSVIRTLTGTVVNTTSVALNITCCNPGYIFDNKTLSCVQDQSEIYQSIILRPDSHHKYVYISPQVYVRWRNGSLLWATIPVIFKKCNSDSSLPGCLFKYDEPDEQCADNRTGFLCGKCQDGESVDLTISQCVKCQRWHAFMIAAIVVAFVAMCALVMIFNVGIPNEMRGFLFYIQVIGFVYSNLLEAERLDWDYYLSSVFGISLYIPLCPYPGYDALHTTSFGFVLPITAIVTISLYIISARCIRHLSNKNSFEGIWFLTFIIYKFVADTCYTILRCQKVNNGRPNEYVYYYDGDVQCFTSEDPTHLGFAVVALILSVLIILFPICILVISYRRFQLTVNITDVLNKGLKPSCRWWASFDLFRRLLVIFIVLLSNYVWPPYTRLALLFTGLLVFFIFANAQPYTSRRANITEALVLMDFLLVASIFHRRNVSKHMPIALLLLLLPFLYAVVYLTINVVAYIWNKCSPMDFKTTCIALLCKILRRVGIKLPFQMECMTQKHAVQLLKDEDQDNLVSDDYSASSDYIKYREELLED